MGPFFRAAEKMGRDPRNKKRGKEAARRAKAVALAYQLNGPDLYVDRYLRNFLTEYNGRLFRGEGMHMPNSYNVMHSFVEPDEKALVLRLLPEKHYSLSFNVLLDRITDPNSDSSLERLAKSLDDLTVHEVNLLGGYAEFKVPGHEDFVFCGSAFCREGDELSIVGVFGKSNPDPQQKRISVSEVDLYPGKSFLHDGKEEIDVSDEALFGDKSFLPIILMTRIDTSKNKVQVRYVLIEKKDTFDVVTDDPQVANYIVGQNGDAKKIVSEYLERLEEFSPLFELLFAAPLCLDLMEDDTIVVERQPTKLRVEASTSSARFVRANLPMSEAPNYVQVATLYGLGAPDIADIPATALAVETDGYWKTLSIGAPGRDRNGNAVQGKTWVTVQTSWFEGKAGLSNPASRTRIQPSQEAETVGDIYVLRSAQHPRDLYKIGFTTKASDERARQLSSTTGQPDFFSVVQSWKVRSPRLIEQHVHELLKEHRINNNREFFQVKFETIRSTIEKVIERSGALIDAP